MALVKLAAIHRVRKRLSDGSVRMYHYVFRGGPQFWNSGSPDKVGSPNYLRAYQQAHDQLRARFAPAAGGPSVADMITKFKASAQYASLSARTRADYDLWLDRLGTEFGIDPIKMFEEPDSLAEIRVWKETWRNSPKQYDYATAVTSVLLNWCVNEDRSIALHHHHRIKRMYKVDRSDWVWLPQEIDALVHTAPEPTRRLAIGASKGGLRPSDLGLIKRKHVQKTPEGRRIYFKTSKRGRVINIPVTKALGEVIDSTPIGQEYLFVSLSGRPLTAERASQMIREQKLAAIARDTDSIRPELRLQDMRGTAATELLRAGCSLNEIAVYMGWELRHAANVIERYAALVPEVADEIRRKLERRRTSG